MFTRDYDAIAARIRREVALLGAGSERPDGAGNPDVFADPASAPASDGAGAGVAAVAPDPAPDEAVLRVVVDALWEALSDEGVSWVGFYRAIRGAPEDRAMVLGPSRDSPACSPIGLHGVCGQAFTGRITRIVRDVSELGERYVACDPRDRSEIVLPCFAGEGPDAPCWGVLDVDSHGVGAFDGADEIGLAGALRAAGIGVRIGGSGVSG